MSEGDTLRSHDSAATAGSGGSGRSLPVTVATGKRRAPPAPLHPPRQTNGQTAGGQQTNGQTVPDAGFSTYRSATLRSLGSGVTSLGSETEEDLSFNTFAERYFPKGADPWFTRADPGQPLLITTSMHDRHDAAALWKVILKFMGDVADYRGGPAQTSTHQPDMGPVMTRLYAQFGITWSPQELDRRRQLAKNEADVRRTGKRRGGTLKRIKASLSRRFWKNTEETIFHTLPLEETLQSELDQLHYIVGYGILKPGLRDEIYAVIMKQLLRNPFKSSLVRGWLLLGFCAGCFPPSDIIIKYVVRYIDDGPPMYAVNVKKTLQRTLQNGNRCQPTSGLELRAGLEKALLEVPVTLPDGLVQAVPADSALSARELLDRLCDVISLRDRQDFSVYIAMYKKRAPLGAGGGHVLDAVSQCEQLHRDQEGGHGSKRNWQLLLRREVFSPWDPLTDQQAVSLTYHQVARGLQAGDFPAHQDVVYAHLAALRHLAEDSGADLQGELPSLLPAPLLQSGTEQRRWAGLVKEQLQQLKPPGGQRPSAAKVKVAVCRYAREHLFLEFSRRFEVKKVDGPAWPHDDVTMAVNSVGVYILRGEEQLYRWLYRDIESIFKETHQQLLTFVLTNGDTLRFSCPDAPELRASITHMLDGLRAHSTWAVAKEHHHAAEEGELSLAAGDLLLLDLPAGQAALQAQTCTATNQNTGDRGSVDTCRIYVIPSLERPPVEYLDKFYRPPPTPTPPPTPPRPVTPPPPRWRSVLVQTAAEATPQMRDASTEVMEVTEVEEVTPEPEEGSVTSSRDHENTSVSAPEDQEGEQISTRDSAAAEDSEAGPDQPEPEQPAEEHPSADDPGKGPSSQLRESLTSEQVDDMFHMGDHESEPASAADRDSTAADSTAADSTAADSTAADSVRNSEARVEISPAF